MTHQEYSTSFMGSSKILKGVRWLLISFGTTGYSLILARAFQEVDETIHHLYRKDKGPKGKFKPDNFVKNNLVMVGPITEEARTATVNLFLERQQAAQRFEKNCTLLTIRPLRIGRKDVWSKFFKLIPQESLFKAQPMDPIKKKLHDDTEGKVSFEAVGEFEGIPMKCHQTQCIFEILVYKYVGYTTKVKDPPLHPPSPPPSKQTRVHEMADPPHMCTTTRPKNTQHAEENRESAIIDLERAPSAPI